MIPRKDPGLDWTRHPRPVVATVTPVVYAVPIPVLVVLAAVAEAAAYPVSTRTQEASTIAPPSHPRLNLNYAHSKVA